MTTNSAEVKRGGLLVDLETIKRSRRSGPCSRHKANALITPMASNDPREMAPARQQETEGRGAPRPETEAKGKGERGAKPGTGASRSSVVFRFPISLIPSQRKEGGMQSGITPPRPSFATGFKMQTAYR